MPDTKFGALKISILRCKSRPNLVHVIIHQGRNLLPMDLDGLSNPYLRLEVTPFYEPPDSKPIWIQTTKKKHKNTLNPIFANI